MVKQQPISLNNFSLQWQLFEHEILAAMQTVGRSAWYILGEEVQAFEQDLANHLGCKYVVGCASGLDALELSLRCLGLQPGEKVLTTPLSAFATTLAIIKAGGVPVFIDIDASGSIDLDLVEAYLQSETDRASYLVPVHLYGHALDLERLSKLREKFQLKVVEDCAQAITARNRGRLVGSAGDLAAYSFYPTKNLGCFGDGGALATNDPEYASLARKLRDYGQSAKYQHEYLGMNSRLDELQAGIMRRVFLPRLAEGNRRRCEIATTYRERIKHPLLSFPEVQDHVGSIWHLFPVLVRGKRDAFFSYLQQHHIGTAIHYPHLIPDQQALKNIAIHNFPSSLSRAQRFVAEVVSLPINPFLSSEEVERVVAVCNEWQG